MADTLVRDSTHRILQVNPSLTYAEIARLLGVSRERIRQVSGQRRRKPRFCKVCREPIRLHRNGITQTAYNLRYCAECWIEAKGNRKKSHLIAFTCETCGETFFRKAGEVKRQQRNGYRVRWCSRQCHGKWLGANYGYNRLNVECITRGEK